MKCRIKRPNEHEITCTIINNNARRSSRIGPNQFNNNESKVKFVQIMLGLSLVGFLLIFIKWNRSNSLKHNLPIGFNLLKSINTKLDASNSFVSELRRGNRCLGQGIIPNNCGNDMQKLNI